MKSPFRRVVFASLIAVTALAGGCSIYASPGDLRIGVALPPLVIGGPMRPGPGPGYAPGYGPRGYGGPGPGYGGPGYGPGYWR